MQKLHTITKWTEPCCLVETAIKGVFKHVKQNHWNKESARRGEFWKQLKLFHSLDLSIQAVSKNCSSTSLCLQWHFSGHWKVAADSSRKRRLTKWWFPASRCLANTDGQRVNGGLRLEAQREKWGGETQWDVFIQTETVSRVEWKQSVPELKRKIMGKREHNRWRAAVEVEWENVGKMQRMGREWAEPRESCSP